MFQANLSLPFVLALALAPIGCSGDKADKSDTKSDKVAPKSTARVSEATSGKTVEVRKLPASSSDIEHKGELRYALTHGSPETDAARDIAVDQNGDFLLAGYYRAPGLFDIDAEMSDGHPDAFLTKLSKKDGSPIWSVTMGGKSPDISEALAVANDGSSVVVGTMSEDFHVGDATMTSEGADDIFVAKFGADGHRIWALRIGGTDIDAAHSVAIDNAGNSYVTGVFRHHVAFGEEEAVKSHGNGDIFLSKFSPGGDFIWTKTFGALDDDFGRDLAIDSKGNVLLLAEIANQVDFGGGALSTNGNRDIVLAKFDENGDHLWSKSMGNNYDDVARSLTIDPADNIIFTGSFEGTAEFAGTEHISAGRADILVAKFNANGEAIWSKSFGAKDEDWGNSISSDSLGNSYISGWFRNEIAFGETTLKSKGDEDAMLLKLNPKGEVLWAKSFGDKGLDMGKAVATVPDNGVVAIGVYHHNVDLGDGAHKPLSVDGKPNQSAEVYLGVFGQ